MNSRIFRQSVVVSSISVLALGCVSYTPKPLPQQNYNDVIQNRAADAQVEATTEITLSEAERIALYLNPRLRAARQMANVAAVDVEYADTWDDPVLSMNVMKMIQNTKHRWVAGGALLFSIPISGRLEVAKDMARAESRAAIVAAWAEEQKVLRELRESWIEWSAARNAQAVYTNERSRYDNASAYVDERVRGGLFAPTDASLFRVTRSRVDLDEAILRTAEQQARIRLVGLMGLTYSSGVVFVPTESVPEWTGDPNNIYSSNPEVLLAEAKYEVAEQNLKLQIRQQYPDITLGPLFEERGGHERLGMGFEIPIPILDGNRGEIARADAERDAARVAWEAAVEKAFNDYAVAMTVRNLAKQRGEVARVAIPLNETQVGDSRTRLEGNDSNTLLLVDSVGNERDAKLTVIEADALTAYQNAALWAIVPEETRVTSTATTTITEAPR